MRTAIQVQTDVLPGSRVEVSAPGLPVGERVDVIIMFPEAKRPAGEDWLDADYLAECVTEPAGEGVTLDQVRAALAKVSGELTADFVAERDER
jgi:phosphosulfolactate phosphohydrolase-like enzyme